MGKIIDMERMMKIANRIQIAMNEDKLTVAERDIVLNMCKEVLSITVVENYLKEKGAVCLKQ